VPFLAAQIPRLIYSPLPDESSSSWPVTTWFLLACVFIVYILWVFLRNGFSLIGMDLFLLVGQTCCFFPTISPLIAFSSGMRRVFGFPKSEQSFSEAICCGILFFFRLDNPFLKVAFKDHLFFPLVLSMIRSFLSRNRWACWPFLSLSKFIRRASVFS